MADELHLTDPTLYANHIKPAANFVASHGPAFGVERWEEQDGYSPSTIAAEIAGLVAAADLADANHDPASAARLARRRRRLPAVDQGLDGDDERPARAALLHPPLEDRRPERRDLLQRRQRRPDARPAHGDRRRLPRARRGSASCPRTTRTSSPRCPSSTRTIRSDTASGPGWHRYNGDGYGDRATDGRPWAPTGVGTGHLWPALSSERGEQSLQTGDAADAASLLDGMARFAGGVGLIPEQDWESPDLAASPFGTARRRRRSASSNGAARRLGRPAELVGRLLRPALRRPRRGPPR